MTSKTEIDTKGDKNRRITTAIANMDIGDSESPTSFFNKISIHPDTGRDLLDLYDSLKEIGFKTIRDKTGKVRAILRTDEELNVRRDIRDIKKDMLEVKEMLDQLNSSLKQKKK